jgi:hypothetical protein
MLSFQSEAPLSKTHRWVKKRTKSETRKTKTKNNDARVIDRKELLLLT